MTPLDPGLPSPGPLSPGRSPSEQGILAEGQAKRFRVARALLCFVIGLLTGPELAGATSRVVGYSQAWDTYTRNFEIADLPGGKLTHVNYAFAKLVREDCAVGDPRGEIQQQLTGDDGSGTGSSPPHFGKVRQLGLLLGASTLAALHRRRLVRTRRPPKFRSAASKSVCGPLRTQPQATCSSSGPRIRVVQRWRKYSPPGLRSGSRLKSTDRAASISVRARALPRQ